MRWLSIPIVAASLCLPLSAQEQKTAETFPMDNYVFGMLKKGPNWNATQTAESKKIGEGHMAHINKMAATGKLVVAGPMMDNGEIRGLLIFKQMTVEEAKALASEDPAVKAGRLVLELHPWFAGAGLTVTGKK